MVLCLKFHRSVSSVDAAHTRKMCLSFHREMPIEVRRGRLCMLPFNYRRAYYNEVISTHYFLLTPPISNSTLLPFPYLEDAVEARTGFSLRLRRGPC